MFDESRLEAACTLLDRWCRADRIPGAALAVGRRDGVVLERVFGRQHLAPGSPAMPEDAIFLIASITKPIVCTALLMLVERGELMLADPVEAFVPEFGRAGKHGVQVRHLLTHTSGLPDMLPENEELRAAHEPLATFIARTCEVSLDFPPGRAVQYQSMGIAMIAEIVRRITGHECREFLRREIFEPLGMHDTALGLPVGPACGAARSSAGAARQARPTEARIAEVRISKEAAATDWHWNSDYWRRFGAPWGGLLTTPADLARFCRLMLAGGELDGARIVSPATVHAMTSNQLAAMPDLPELERRCRPWGLGWRLNWPGHSQNFGDLLSEQAYGHWGATGTLLWIDPARDAFLVLLTTQPQEPDGRYLARISNMVAAAIA